MKQTALEWLYEEFTKTNYLTEDEFYMIFNQAKEMEKEQIIDTFQDSRILSVTNNCSSGEQYYNETFKQQEQ
jgi:hypothetical protein